MRPPVYKAITEKDIILSERPGVQFRLVSGTYEDKKGPAPSEVITAMLRMEPAAEYGLTLPANYNSAIYVLEGKVRINEIEVAGRFDLVHL